MEKQADPIKDILSFMNALEDKAKHESFYFHISDLEYNLLHKHGLMKQFGDACLNLGGRGIVIHRKDKIEVIDLRKPIWENMKTLIEKFEAEQLKTLSHD